MEIILTNVNNLPCFSSCLMGQVRCFSLTIKSVSATFCLHPPYLTSEFFPSCSLGSSQYYSLGLPPPLQTHNEFTQPGTFSLPSDLKSYQWVEPRGTREKIISENIRKDQNVMGVVESSIDWGFYMKRKTLLTEWGWSTCIYKK